MKIVDTSVDDTWVYDHMEDYGGQVYAHITVPLGDPSVITIPDVADLPEAVVEDVEPSSDDVIPPLTERKYTIDEQDALDDWQTVPTSKALHYLDTADGDIDLQYYSGTVLTTWADIHTIVSLDGDQRERAVARLLGDGNKGNRRTALLQMIKAVEHGVKPRDVKDPDADYKPILHGVIDTHTDGKIEPGEAY
ncbi:MAG: hypothetical protein ACXQTE_01350 [Methanosarcinaceae archaeon]